MLLPLHYAVPTDTESSTAAKAELARLYKQIADAERQCVAAATALEEKRKREKEVCGSNQLWVAGRKRCALAACSLRNALSRESCNRACWASPAGKGVIRGCYAGKGCGCAIVSHCAV